MPFAAAVSFHAAAHVIVSCGAQSQILLSRIGTDVKNCNRTDDSGAAKTYHALLPMHLPSEADIVCPGRHAYGFSISQHIAGASQIHGQFRILYIRAVG